MKTTTIHYNKILLTHDGSTLAGAAVPHAISVARQYNAEIILLRVVDDIIMTIPNFTPIGEGTITAEMSENITGGEKHKAKRHLMRLCKKLLEEGVSNVSIAVKDGIVAEEIIKFINTNNVDLVVMSTHGSSGIIRAILGSVADEVVRHAASPVMLIHPIKSNKKKIARRKKNLQKNERKI